MLTRCKANKRKSRYRLGASTRYADIGLRAGKIFGVRIIFVRIFPNLPEKYFCHFLCEYFFMTTVVGWPPKNHSSCDSAHVGRHFFQIKVRRAPLLPLFSGNLPKFSRILQRFTQIFADFSRISEILPGFLPNQNFWGCACTLCTPASTNERRIIKNTPAEWFPKKRYHAQCNCKTIWPQRSRRCVAVWDVKIKMGFGHVPHDGADVIEHSFGTQFHFLSKQKVMAEM